MNIKTFTDFDNEPKTSNQDSNVYDITNLNGFSEKYLQLKENLRKVDLFIESYESVAKELNELVKKEEFETVIAAHIIHVNESVENLKKYTKDITATNYNTLNENFNGIILKVRKVLDLVNEQQTKNTKLIFEGALAQDRKINELRSVVDKIDTNVVTEKLSNFSNKINELTSYVEEQIPAQSKKLNQLSVNNDASLLELKNKQNRLAEKVNKDVTNIGDGLVHVGKTIDQLKQEFQEEIKVLPKLKNKIVETEVKLDKKINELKEGINSQIDSQAKSFLEKVESVNSTVENINEDLSALVNEIPNHKTKIVGIEVDVDKLQREVKSIKTDNTVNIIDEKVQTVEKDLSKLNLFVQEQNSKLQTVGDEVKEATQNVRKLLFDERYIAFNKKLEHLEEILSKFNDKTVLTEEIYPNASQKTSDPLTPLNQNFVTFEQLQKHYQLFINRIQQQLTTLGGGGSSRLWDLDDTDYNTVKNPSNGDVLKFVSANARWEAGVVSGGTSYDQNLNTTDNVTFANLTTTGDVVITGNLAVLGNSTIFNTSTIVAEDKNILLANGAASAAVADGSGITIDGAQANIVYLNAGDKWELNKNLNVLGNISATGTITSPFFYSESDLALKDDVQPISNALDKVLNLFGVSFKWKSNQTKSIGVIAQDVEKVVPEIVSSSYGSKTVSYDSLIPLLIEAIKEQQTQINELKSKLNEKY
jgi:predicted  nucleic acid-binding Zn-ribbon protein